MTPTTLLDPAARLPPDEVRQAKADAYQSLYILFSEMEFWRQSAVGRAEYETEQRVRNEACGFAFWAGLTGGTL